MDGGCCPLHTPHYEDISRRLNHDFNLLPRAFTPAPAPRRARIPFSSQVDQGGTVGSYSRPDQSAGVCYRSVTRGISWIIKEV
tara:strand:- start:2191 stop:2439 length:249 start_codon:yes stop_codon:yes gene_type:complete